MGLWLSHLSLHVSCLNGEKKRLKERVKNGKSKEKEGQKIVCDDSLRVTVLS